MSITRLINSKREETRFRMQILLLYQVFWAAIFFKTEEVENILLFSLI